MLMTWQCVMKVQGHFCKFKVIVINAKFLSEPHLVMENDKNLCTSHKDCLIMTFKYVLTLNFDHFRKFMVTIWKLVHPFLSNREIPGTWVNFLSGGIICKLANSISIVKVYFQVSLVGTTSKFISGADI